MGTAETRFKTQIFLNLFNHTTDPLGERLSVMYSRHRLAVSTLNKTVHTVVPTLQ